jgi:hypothetical protein
MILKLVDNKKIITEPDVDYSRSFKILLIDFEWESITQISEAVKKINAPVTLFLYGSNDKNPEWCIAAAKNSTSVLINMINRGSIETLKGFLLGESNVFTYGHYDLEKIFQRNVLDSLSWLAVQYEQWYKIHEVKNANLET